MRPPAAHHVRALSPQQRRARADRLAWLSDEEQFAALGRREFTLDEWCASARQFPGRVAHLGGELCFIAVTNPELCER